jgi:hypothetical protein
MKFDMQNPARGPNGRFQVYLQDPGPVSEREAVRTIAHGVKHIRDGLAGRNAFDHETAEQSAELVGEFFR